MNKAEENISTSIIIFKDALGEKHPLTSNAYYSLGNLNILKKEYSQALINFQHALISTVNNFYDHNIYVNPVLERNNQTNLNINSTAYMLDALIGKATVFEIMYLLNQP